MQKNENSFSVFPNPTNQSLTLGNLPAGENCKVIISDVAGKVIYHTSVSGIQTNIDVRNFGKGVYFVQLRNAGRNKSFFETKKIIIN